MVAVMRCNADMLMCGTGGAGKATHRTRLLTRMIWGTREDGTCAAMSGTIHVSPSVLPKMSSWVEFE